MYILSVMYILICIIHSIYNYLLTVYMELLFQLIQSIVEFILSIVNTYSVNDDTKRGWEKKSNKI